MYVYNNLRNVIYYEQVHNIDVIELEFFMSATFSIIYLQKWTSMNKDIITIIFLSIFWQTNFELNTIPHVFFFTLLDVYLENGH